LSRQVHRYPRGHAVGYGLCVAFGVAILLAGAAAFVREGGLDLDSWIGLAGIAGLTVVAGARFVRQRPVMVDDQGLALLLLGRPMRRIAWSEIASVERQGEDAVDVTIRDGRHLVLTDSLTDFAGLRAQLEMARST
jgi:hypothetical protein